MSSTAVYRKGWGKIVAERYDALRVLDGPYLDVGCASGDYVLTLNAQGERVRGFDVEENDQWLQSPGLFSQGSAEAIPFADDSFATVYSFEVLEHLRQPEKALTEMLRVATRYVLLSVPNCEPPAELRASGLSFNHYTDPTHVNFFTADSLHALLESVGLEPVYVRKINRAKPEHLFFASQGLPPVLVRLFSRLSQMNPWARSYPMTLLALARVPGAAAAPDAEAKQG
ncbi:hypothetical protein BST95_19235 [Halioglobus japonicus]|uniref:Class I SAM-dependent methyltransferase n=1 Tax=Halioglobus japonicus TaxID=930805 RepID=A0AAP8MBF8_9GAMM|nr:class I SAM-dependent methyltransferase [Halioglobus japonicus]AQA20056.1 hypothetical protein BST95_19235 [Halioglobus japonicus]PLW84716.1 class I SAM-dependent methyltransferase [Halioglobus japonicus]GHD21042.1 hypothetical protein GCM10007052_31390 [Halioglobus japonicus]